MLHDDQEFRCTLNSKLTLYHKNNSATVEKCFCFVSDALQQSVVGLVVTRHLYYRSCSFVLDGIILFNTMLIANSAITKTSVNGPEQVDSRHGTVKLRQFTNGCILRTWLFQEHFNEKRERLSRRHEKQWMNVPIDLHAADLCFTRGVLRDRKPLITTTKLNLILLARRF